MKTESILFLDVDGVLNSQVWYRSKEFNELWKARRPFTEDWELEAFDPKAISVLNTILDTFPELQIVVSSTWRLSHTPEQAVGPRLAVIYRPIRKDSIVYYKTP